MVTEEYDIGLIHFDNAIVRHIATPSAVYRLIDFPSASRQTTTPILILHGLMSFPDLLVPFARTLQAAAGGTRVLLMSLPGHSIRWVDDPALPFDLAAHISTLILALQDPIIPPSFILVGHSVGGGIATLVANTLPHRVRALALIAPAGLAKGASSQRAAKALRMFHRLIDFPAFSAPCKLILSHIVSGRVWRAPSSVTPTLRRNYLQQLMRLPRFWATIYGYVRGFPWDEMDDEYRLLGTHGFPVLALWGSHDEVLPAYGLEKLGELLPSAQRRRLEGYHHALPTCAPERTCAEIMHLLAVVEPEQ
eukprot:gnl/Dysnectes_brevis/8398_a14882_240.p1 GENE.gnl/Dysnectes_brevis/8398_a14882_240~~gnl/Dysnectes_brevis/8398_a14882_240.p1  ORF type:complete len:307 (+),score=62.10 gnl/Dysnectes_brevis/8398_a14882_240:152-1072(+)